LQTNYLSFELPDATVSGCSGVRRRGRLADRALPEIPFQGFGKLTGFIAIAAVASALTA
jgi:hypothetical protein